MRGIRLTIAVLLLGVLLAPAIHNHQLLRDDGSERYNATKSGCGACVLDLRSIVLAKSVALPIRLADAHITSSEVPATVTGSVDSPSSRAPPLS